MSNDFLQRATGFYFIGIGGVSMSALAEYLLSKGYRVRGSDSAPNERCERLKKLGAGICFPQSEENLAEENVVVYSSAISKDNAEYTSALKRGKLLLSRAEFLNLIGRSFPHAIYIAGSHGKTTTCAMTAHIFSAAGRSFTMHLGGEDLAFGNFYSSGEEFFISEACEYQKNILNLFGETAVVLNTDLDHGECYESKQELEKTYEKFLSRAKNKIFYEGCFSNGITFSFGEGNYTADGILGEGERYRFRILENGVELCRVRLNVYGAHHILNALAACAVARTYGIGEEAIARGLVNFVGVKRRFETVGCFSGCRVVCDYAHHPTEISSALCVAEKLTTGKLYVIFQPHTYSRTKLLFSDFVRVLRDRNVAVYKTYAARESFCREGDGKTLAEAIGCPYLESEEELRSHFSAVKENDLILLLGAGDIYERTKDLLRRGD